MTPKLLLINILHPELLSHAMKASNAIVIFHVAIYQSDPRKAEIETIIFDLLNQWSRHEILGSIVISPQHP